MTPLMHAVCLDVMLEETFGSTKLISSQHKNKYLQVGFDIGIRLIIESLVT